MSTLKDVPRPGADATQNLYCSGCGAMLGARTGGGAVTGGDTDAEIEARMTLHDVFHASIEKALRGETLVQGPPVAPLGALSAQGGEPLTSPLSDLAFGEELAVKVSVTAGDIAEGEREDCWGCPVARALNRAFPGYLSEVGCGDISLYQDLGNGDMGLEIFQAKTPGEAGTFICGFDGDETVEPFTFMAVFRRITRQDQ